MQDEALQVQTKANKMDTFAYSIDIAPHSGHIKPCSFSF